ncbi:MAG TPA: YidC/Oxa1 family membrane protein insertase [Nevskiaceae bacterium]|nr:YidC/Oxa1 family membrane protein insertase [Nevskiaceae bacterium]
MFTTLIVQPIFNLLVLIYAVLPGHNFGLAIIIFTIIVRLLMWPLVKKQLHQTKAMRKVQPELKRIKAAAKGDKRKEQQMMMELYKERGINPFGSIGVLILQIPILIGLYIGLTKVVHDPHALISFSYPALQDLGWMKELASNIHRFDSTLFGVVDLTRPALGPKGTYMPALLIVIGSAVIQYYQSKQLMPNDKNARGLRTILKDAGGGKQADQAEVNAAVGRSTRYLLPAMIFIFTVNIASALSLYWLVSGLVAYIQQSIVLREDTEEMEAAADKPTPADREKNAVEAEVITQPKPKKKAVAKSKSSRSTTKKRRKK